MRKLLSGADWPTDYHGAIIHLVEIATDIQIHYWSTAAVASHGGHAYAAWFVFDEPIHRYRSLEADYGSVKLQNTDGQMEGFIFAEKFDGAAVRILRYFVDLNDAGELLRGLLTERQANEREISWRVIPTWDPNQIDGPPRNYARSCTWRFKSDQCGYTTGGLTTCDKDYASCTARGQTHRFNGFLQVSADLAAVYPATEDVPASEAGALEVT